MLARTRTAVSNNAGATQSKRMIAQNIMKLTYLVILARATCRDVAVPKWDSSSRRRLA